MTSLREFDSVFSVVFLSLVKQGFDADCNILLERAPDHIRGWSRTVPKLDPNLLYWAVRTREDLTADQLKHFLYKENWGTTEEALEALNQGLQLATPDVVSVLAAQAAYEGSTWALSALEGTGKLNINEAQKSLKVALLRLEGLKESLSPERTVWEHLI